MQLQSLKLDQARQTDPWELISTPTVLDKPVAPRKKPMVALGLVGGLILGCGAALLQDRRSGLLFSEAELKNLMPGSMLQRLSDSDTRLWENTFSLLVKGPLAEAQSVALIPVGKISEAQLERLEEGLSQALGTRKLLVTNDLLASREYNTQLLITSLGALERQKLLKFREQLRLQNSPVAGWLLIDSSKEA